MSELLEIALAPDLDLTAVHPAFLADARGLGVELPELRGYADVMAWVVPHLQPERLTVLRSWTVFSGPPLPDHLRQEETLDPGITQFSVWSSDQVRSGVYDARVEHDTKHPGAVLRAGSLPMRLQIYDDAAALVPIDPADNPKGAYLVEHPELLLGLRAVFTRLWRSLDPADAEIQTARHPDPLAVVEQLMAGVTDATASRTLGIPLRTYRRRVQQLMTSLGVDSRFAAGVRAQQLGFTELLGLDPAR